MRIFYDLYTQTWFFCDTLHVDKTIQVFTKPKHFEHTYRLKMLHEPTYFDSV